MQVGFDDGSNCTKVEIMLFAGPSLRSFRFLRRVVALGGVGLVLALDWLASDGSAHRSLHIAAAGDPHAACGHDHDYGAGGDHSGHSGGPGEGGAGRTRDGAGTGAACDDPGCAVRRYAAGATDPFQPQVLRGTSQRYSPWRKAPSADRGPNRTPLAWPAPSCGPPQRA